METMIRNRNISSLFFDKHSSLHSSIALFSDRLLAVYSNSKCTVQYHEFDGTKCKRHKSAIQCFPLIFINN